MLELTNYTNQTNALNPNANSQLIELSTNIAECLDNIKSNTLKIGYNLKQIRDSKCYESGEYKSEIEYGEAVFGFKKSAIYSFIKLADLYLDDSGNMKLREGDNYSPSQLEAMTSIPYERLEGMIESKEITPSMTVKTIKEKAKEEKKKINNVVYDDNDETVKKEKEKRKEENKTTSLLSINVTQKGNETPVIVWNYGDESGSITQYKSYDEIAFANIIEQLNSFIHDIQARAKEYQEKVNVIKGMSQTELKEYIDSL